MVYILVPALCCVSEDQMLDPSLIEAAITKKTKAMPVHLTGRMAKMDQIIEIANQYGLDVIEDSAQSIGSAFKGKKVVLTEELGVSQRTP